MRRHLLDSSDNGESEIDLTPMLDVVFIMLIFFVVTTSFVKESGIDVNRPSAKTAQKQEQGNILLAIRPDGEIWIDGRTVDIRTIRSHIERLRIENPEGEVVIQGDRLAQIGRLVTVMDQVRLAGITTISIAAEQGSN
ncbi:MAG: biopolymer transporter ExbD [Magnetococcales bacterium]|nr:biopolymer transporter ExbD [Magnetococcales bacterium]